MVRLSYMYKCLFQNIEGNVFSEIPQRDILQQAIRISDRLMVTPLRNIVRDYSLGLQGRLEDVEKYINEIARNTEGYPFLWSHVQRRQQLKTNHEPVEPGKIQ